MAKADFTFRIKIDGDKAVIEATEATRKLGKEVDKTNKAQARANKSASSHQRTQERGVMQTANNARNFSKLSQTIGSGDNGLVGAYATLAANTFAVTAAFVALQRATEALKIIEGLETQSARLGTTLSITAARMREVTNDAISMAQAMSSTAQLTAGGFNADEIERLAVVAKDAAGALGRDLQDAIDRLTRGVTKLEPELLDELGIMTRLDEATRKYAVENNKAAESLTATEKRQAFLNAVLSEGERKFGGIGDSVDKYSAFTRLAATATDAFNSVVGVLATVLAPVAELFADNQLFIVGAVVAYAGSIRKDLIPVLTEASSRQKDFLEDQRTALDAQKKGFLDSSTLDGAKDSSGRFFSIATKEALEEFNVQLDGSENAATFTKSIATLERQIDGYDDTLSQTGLSVQKINSLHKQQEGAKIALANVKALQANYLQMNVALAESEVLERASNTSLRNLGTSYREIVKGVKQYYTALVTQATAAQGGAAANTALSRSLIAVRAGFKSAGLAAKAFGIAVLNMLPVIGQIILVLTVLWEGLSAVLDMFRDDGYEDYVKSMEEVNTINEAASEKISRLTEVQEAAISSYSSQIEAIKLQGNAIVELTNAYVGLSEAANNNDTSFLDQAIAGATINPFDTPGADSASASIRRLFEDQPLVIGDAVGFETLKEGIRSVENAYELTNEAGKRYIDTQLEGIDTSADYEAQSAQIAQVLEGLGSRYLNTAASVENLAETFKNLEESTTQFIQSATNSTPVDDLLKSLTAVNGAVAELSLEMQKGNITSAEFGRSLASLSPQSRNLLGEGLTEVLALDGITAQMAVLKDLGENITEEQKDRLEFLEREGDILAASIAPQVERTLQARENEISALQSSFRLLKAQLDIENARYKTVQDLFKTGREGYLAREEHEEKVRAAQASQLEMQSAILSVMETQAQITLDSLKSREAELQLQILLVTVMGNQATEMLRIFNIQESITTLTGQARADAIASLENEGSGQRESLEALSQELAVVRNNITGAESAMKDLSDAIQSLDDQKAAILAQNLTEAQKAARAMGAEFQVAREFLEELDTYAATLTGLNRSIAEFNRLISIGNNSNLESATQLLETYNDTRDSLIEQTSIRIEELKISRQQAQADIARGLSSATQNAAAQRTLEVLDKQLANQEEQLRVALLAAEAETRLEVLKLAIFDATKDTVEWQQQGLSYLEKEAALQGQIANSLQEGADARRDRQRIRSGIATTDQTTSNDAVRAAREAFIAAKAQAEVQVAVIDAEYALMDAQKVALEQELRSRRAILQAMGANSEFLAPLNNAISTLENVNISDLRNTAINAISAGVEASAETLATAIVSANAPSTIGGSTGAFLSRQRDRRERDEETARAIEELNKDFTASSNVAIATTRETGIEMVNAVEQGDFQVSFENTPMGQMASDVYAIREAVVGGSGIPGVSNIADLGQFLQGEGLRVSEQSQFGGVRANHSGAGHREDRAIDVNFGLGNVEADDPAMRAQFDSIAQRAANMGFVVLWNGTRYAPEGNSPITSGGAHRDHLHIEERRGGIPATAIASRDADTSPIARSASTQDVQATRDRLQSENGDGLQAISGLLEESLIPQFEELGTLGLNFIHLTDEIGRVDRFEKLRLGLQEFRGDFGLAVADINTLAASMGEDGEIILAISGGIDTMLTSFEAMATAIKNGEGVALTALSATAAAISTIQSITQASSDARVRAIDAEITAEQNRDGQSATSLAKIEALEQKKEQMQRKQFEMNKKMMMAQAVIATATGITQALALPFPMNLIMAGVIGALGAAQLAVIAGTSFQGGSTSTASTSAASISVGKVGSSVNLDNTNSNAGGEIGFLRGSQGTGSNASNFRTVGSAYGGMTNRGYGHRSFLVGEKGPETVEMDEPMKVKPGTEGSEGGGNSYHINAIDAKSLEDMLRDNPAPIIEGLQKVANSSGQDFMRDVDTRSFGGTKR